MPELLLPRLKREIEARLAELRPLVAEAAHLQAAKQALLEDQAPSSPRQSAPAPDEAPSRGERTLAPRIRMAAPALRAAMPSAGAMATPVRTAAGDRARNGGGETNGTSAPPTSRDIIVALVEERPGVSVAEIASVTKLPKPTVATTVSKLKRDGVFADEAGGVKLASRQPLTLEQVASAMTTRDDGVDDAEWDAARPGKPEGAAA